MEKIGYIKTEHFNKSNEAINNFVLNSNIEFGFRNIVENMTNVLQPVCAAMIFTKNGKILAIEKTIKSTGIISPEKGKTLLYVGGHLDNNDESKSNIESFRKGMIREVQEEFSVDLSNAQIEQPIAVYIPNNEKSKKHVGIIFPVILEKEFAINVDKSEMVAKKCRFINIEKVASITNLEDWSKKSFENFQQINKAILKK